MTGVSSADMEKMTAGRMILQIFNAFIVPFTISHALAFGAYFFGTTNLASLLPVAGLLWLGFVVPTTLAPTMWEGKPWKLWAINAGYYLVIIILDAAIISNWL